MFRWLTGVVRVSGLSRWANALVTSDDVNAVGPAATRIALQALVYIFARKVWVAMKADWTDALYA